MTALRRAAFTPQILQPHLPSALSSRWPRSPVVSFNTHTGSSTEIWFGLGIFVALGTLSTSGNPK
eukprot:2282500-Pyramimonas_sp.AAC.1